MPLDERLFIWDANYNRTSSTSTNPNLATPVTVTRNFTYDAADQLILSTSGPLEYQFITVTQPASPYTFDGVGNRRTTVELGGAVRTYLQRSTDPPLDAPVNQDTNSFLGAVPPPGRLLSHSEPFEPVEPVKTLGVDPPALPVKQNMQATVAPSHPDRR